MKEPEERQSLDTTPSDDLESSEDLEMLSEDWPSGLSADNEFDIIAMLSTALDQVSQQISRKKNELQEQVSQKKKEFQDKTTDWTAKTGDRIRELKVQRNTIQALLRKYEQVVERMNRDTQTVQLRDKVSFVVGVGNTCITPVLAIRTPHWIPLYYTVQFLYLLTLRFVNYKSQQWHYFIFDLCYFVNVMTLLFHWFFPGSTHLFVATFALTNGPVAWAIVTWRNSLVFHSLDKVTSVFIHIFPPLVTYVIRWMPVLHHDAWAMIDYRRTRYPAMATLDDVSFRDCLIDSTIAYLIWQVLYFVFIIDKRREKVESGSRMTSYSWLLDDAHGPRGFIQRTAYMFGAKYKMHMFILLQLVYNIATSVPTYFLYKHFWLHTAFLIAMFSVSIWNGAGYYIEVFSRRYVNEIEQKFAKKKQEDQDATSKKTE